VRAGVAVPSYNIALAEAYGRALFLCPSVQAGPIIADLEKLAGVEARQIHVDKGYRGQNHPHKFGVWISGQVRRVTASIRRQMRRRAAVEPVIGHLKADHRMGRNYLKGPQGDRINAVLAAASYNFSLLLRWLAQLLHALILELAQINSAAQTLP
jgi:IS5 family transposase